MLQQWNEIEAKIKSEESPTFLYQEPDLIGITARDFLTDDIDRVQVDKKDDYDRLLSIIQKVDPKSNTRKKFPSLMKKSLFSKDLMSKDKSNKLS